jgi:hypothetical protein
MSRNITSVYFDGLKLFVETLNKDLYIQAGHCYFDIHDRDDHVAARAVERKIDLVGLLKSSKKILHDNLCMLVYEIHRGVKQFAVRTPYGHLVFRVTYIENRCGYRLNLCTITPVTYSHDYDFILCNKENG